MGHAWICRRCAGLFRRAYKALAYIGETKCAVCGQHLDGRDATCISPSEIPEFVDALVAAIGKADRLIMAHGKPLP